MYIVTGNFCMPCKLLKNWLKVNNIEIEERLADDISSEELERLNITQTPTLVLDNDTVIKGKDNIIEYLEGETE